MKIVCTMPVRNEDWILGLTARAVLMWADHLVILDHASTDQSSEIIGQLTAEYPGRLTVITESGQVWEEMRHRQRLLDVSRALGASHIAIVDADEILSGNLVSGIRDQFDRLPGYAVMQLPWLCLRGSINRYHVAGVWSQQQVSMGFRDDPAYHWAARNGYDFHHRHPMGKALIPFQPVRGQMGGLMHLQFVSGRRLRAKQALYKLTEVLRWPGREPVSVVDRRYNLAVYGRETAPPMAEWLDECPASWWAGYEHLMQHYRPHETPWQEAECLRLLEEHGPKRFAGLDLFGLGERFHARD